MMDLHDLQLDDARSLLEHGGSPTTLTSDIPPAVYIQKVIDGLCELSLKDPLTGLANRRHFRAVLEREIDVVARSGESALLLMIDIDKFKNINDTYGHLAGDIVLQAVSRSLAACVRPMDTVARYGGEEFAVLLPSCPSSFGDVVAERIRQTIETLSISVSPLLRLQVTVSIGGAYAPEWVRSTAALWTERADVQRYRAKSEGRNQVHIDPQPVIAVSAEEKNLLFGHLSVGEPAWIESSSGDTSVSSADQVHR
jgi:two-component system cell cycle response regulator